MKISLSRIAICSTAIFCVALCQATSAVAASAPLSLVENGKSAYVIALPSDALPAEKTAAAELQNYLAQISGATLPIKTESAVNTAAPQILVGLSTRTKKLAAAELKKIGRDGIVIKRAGNTLVVAGDRPRATLYAVNELLENLGVRWWTKTESFVPKKKTLRVLSDAVYTPPFYFREHYATDVQKDARFAMHMRQNGHHNPLGEELGGNIRIVGGVHTFDKLLPPQKYFAQHPEWYSDVNNGNVPCTASSKMPAPQLSQLNLTNPAMRAELVKNALQWLRDDPTAAIISISQNDNTNYCRSEGDIKIIEREGSPSGALLDFVNYVATEIEKEFPRVVVETLAYQYTRTPPKTIRPRANVLIRLCSIEADFAHPLTASTNADFQTDARAWKAIASRLFVWDYTTNFHTMIWPHPNLRVLAPNLRFFAAHNIGGVFEQGDAATNNISDFPHLRVWLISQLMWNPQRDDSALINEFLRGYYGAAAPHLRAYLDEIQAAFLKSGGKLSTFQSDATYLSLNVVDAAWKHFQDAQNAVKNDAVLSARVRRERLALDNVIIARYAQLQRENWLREYSAKSPALPADMSAFIADFVEVARQNGVAQINESEPFENYALSLRDRYSSASLPASLREKLADALREGRVIDVQESRFSLYRRGDISEIVDDAAASNGKSGRLLGSANDWALSYTIDESRDILTAAPWRLYVVARVETKPNATRDGKAFSAGIYDTINKKVLLDKNFGHDENSGDGTLADGSYHVFEVGRTELDKGCYVYMAPPQRDDMAFVYIDRILLVREK